MLIVEGEKDVVTAAALGALAVTNADGAGKWTAEDTRTLIGLGARKIVVCPDNDAPGIDHGVRVAKFFQSGRRRDPLARAARARRQGGPFGLGAQSG